MKLKKSSLLRQVVSAVLIFLQMTPVFAQVLPGLKLNLKPQIHKVFKPIDSKRCGSFVVSNDPVASCPDCLSSADVKAEKIGTTDKKAKKWYRTGDAQTVILPSQSLLSDSKNSKELLDSVFLDLIKRKVEDRFNEAFAFAVEDSNPELQDSLKKAKEYVLEKGSDKPSRQIRKLLALFPTIETELFEENEAYRPLICRHEVWKNRNEIIKTSSKIIGLVTLVGGTGGLVAAAIWGIGWMPAVFYGMSGLKFINSGVDIRNMILKTTDVTAGRAAKKILELYQLSAAELDAKQKELSELKKQGGSADSIKTLQLQIADLQTATNEIKTWIPDLNKAVKEKKKYKWVVLKAITSTTLGAAALFGGNYFGGKLSDFKNSPVKTIPANGIDPGDPYTPGEIFWNGDG